MEGRKMFVQKEIKISENYREIEAIYNDTLQDQVTYDIINTMNRYYKDILVGYMIVKDIELDKYTNYGFWEIMTRNMS